MVDTVTLLGPDDAAGGGVGGTIGLDTALASPVTSVTGESTSAAATRASAEASEAAASGVAVDTTARAGGGPAGLRMGVIGIKSALTSPPSAAIAALAGAG